jgi:FAD/FMN-containing dehydrogenase
VANFKSNHTFENWAHTLKFKPDRFCQPKDQAEVVEVVKDVFASGGRVRTQGAGHSWAQLIVTDHTLLQLDNLSHALIADVLKRRFTVEAGVRLKNLIKMLEKDGLAMRNIGSITEQSIAGAISTGTHGTGVRLGNISRSIVGMKLVTGTGDVLTIKETDTELLNAARVSVGALGIITEVTLDCVPMYELEYNAYCCKFDDVIDKFDLLNQENERFLVWWLVAPFGPKDNCIVVTTNPPGTPAGFLDTAAAATGGNSPKNPLPMDSEDLLSLILKLFPTKPFNRILHQRGKYYDMLSLPLIPILHREMEYAVPVANASDTLRAIRRIVEEGDISTTLPIEVRFVAKDDSLLSPARGRDVCYIGVSTQPNANEVYERVEPLLKDAGGRPHWGKCFSLTRGELEAMYPDSHAKFCEIRSQLDPKGVFLNTLSKQFFA